VCTKLPTPEPLVQDGDVRRIALVERAAREGEDAEKIEDSRFGGHDGDAPGRIRREEVPVRRGIRGERRDCARLLAERAELEQTDGSDLHQAAGIRVRQRAQEHGVRHREHRGRRADAEREDRDAYARHPRRLQQRAERVSDLSHDCRHVGCRAMLA
jgi:hypothetical protein